jgi:hypothetical protein
MSKKITFTTPECQVCHQTGFVIAPEEGVKLWQEGAFIQDALPGLTANEREQMVSGLHPRCWDTLFPEGEED